MARSRLALCTLAASVVVACASGSNVQRWPGGVWADSGDESYRLAFVEFSERGNLLDRRGFDHLTEELSRRDDLLVVAFVHGWRHNAREDDSNVRDFGRFLRDLSAVPELSREVIGVYIGWPGVSVRWPLFQEATFWARKAVAEQVGKGGATEVLLRLERAVVDDERDNLFVLAGHSLGGGIVLSALNEVFLDRVLGAVEAKGCGTTDPCEGDCVQARAFGHAVVLLNPAIEANEILQLKEVITQRCFPPEQDKLLHVISTDTDQATHRYFRWGQKLAMLKWRERDLDRIYRGEDVQISEKELDRTTAGNFAQFRTGVMTKEGRDWKYCSYARGNFKACPLPEGIAAVPEDLIPTRTFEPVSFIYTDGGFMADHNDVFNERVAAYLIAVAMESVDRRGQGPGLDLHGCGSSGFFDFGPCFRSLQRVFEFRD